MKKEQTIGMGNICKGKNLPEIGNFFFNVFENKFNGFCNFCISQT